MHPSIVRDNPKDKCPICFMPLSKRKKGEAGEAEPLPAGIVSRVQLSPYRVVLAGVQHLAGRLRAAVARDRGGGRWSSSTSAGKRRLPRGWRAGSTSCW